MRREKTRYPGVSIYTAKSGEKTFYVSYRLAGRLIEEPVGKASHGMTAAKAAQRRSDRLRGDTAPNTETRAANAAKTVEGDVTVGDVWEAYLNYKGEYPARRTEASVVALYLLPSVGDRLMESIQPTEYDAMIRRILQSKKRRTAVAVGSILRRLSRFATKKRICPGLTFQPEIPEQNPTKTRFLSADEIARVKSVIAAWGDRLSASAVMFALATGVRKGALKRLEWSDVDTQAGRIKLRDPKGREKGAEEFVPLSSAAQVILNGVKTRLGEPRIFGGCNLQKSWVGIRQAAGLKNFTFHDLRHSFASLAIQAGADLYTVSKMLNHKSVSITQRYAHIQDKALRDAADKVGDLIRF